jgi:serine/threonine protein kinase
MFDHPHVVKLYEYLDSKDDIYVILEYVPSGELFEMISDKGMLPEPEARKYFHQIIYALDYIHSFGVAHRDLKPENILLDADNNIKLVDFGLSNIMKEGRALKTSCGSPNYAAPEVINGKSYDGGQIDVWSCGVILYAMLFGELPFDEENINTMFKYIKEAKYFMKGVASIEAKDLLNRMIQPNPFRRITITEVLTHPWFDMQVSKYLLDPYKSYRIFDNCQILDNDIIDELIKLDKNLESRNRKEIEEAILKGEIPHYDYLKHAKMLNDIRNEDKQACKTTNFSRVLNLSKKSIQILNKIYLGLVNVNDRILLQKETRAEEAEEKYVENEAAPRFKSFKTNTTSTANIRDFFWPENLKNRTTVGVIYRTNINNLVKSIFIALKELKIVWKKWNSDYIYKCQTGIPKSEEKNLKNKIHERINEFYENDMLKFFLHFTQVSKRKEVVEINNS